MTFIIIKMMMMLESTCQQSVKCTRENVCVCVCACVCVCLPACVCAQPQSMAEVLAKKEELADRLERANEEAIASAIAEEEQLTREIQAENSELETDNESDFTVSVAGAVGAAGGGLSRVKSTRGVALSPDTLTRCSAQAGMNSGGCGLNLDWSEVLAEYEGELRPRDPGPPEPRDPRTPNPRGC